MILMMIEMAKQRSLHPLNDPTHILHQIKGKMRQTPEPNAEEMIEGELVFPDRATLDVCVIDDRHYKEEMFNFWDNMYGFDMSCIKNLSLAEPLVEYVSRNTVVTNNCKLKEFDIQTGKKEDIAFVSPFHLQIKRNDYVQ